MNAQQSRGPKNKPPADRAGRVSATQGRKYFDSGDYALSQARKPSDAGAVTTGSEHPLRETIPHPLSPVPSSSNVDESANEQGEVSPGLDHAESHAAGARLRGSSITTALERKNSSHLSEEMLPQVGGSHEAGREDVERGRKR